MDELLEAVEAGLEAPDAGGSSRMGVKAVAMYEREARNMAYVAAESQTRPALPAGRPTRHAFHLPCCPPALLPACAAGFYQRRVAALRLLGELYNYKLLNSHVVFATLHLILAYGHEAGTPPEVTRWVGGGLGRHGHAWWQAMLGGSSGP